MNQVQLVGRLTKDIELRDVQGAKKVGSFTLAVDRRNKEKSADFIRCKVWNVQAMVMAKHIKKGHRVGIVGRIETGQYEKDGHTVYTTEVVVDNFEFLEPKRSQPQGDGFVDVGDYPDLPF